LIGLLRSSSSSDPSTWIVVSNEVGMGVVPAYRLGRFYRDALGTANQRLARAADRVILMVAGLPWELKPRS
jgi:adenosylcobinamide kinase/adenosylcobinamide-phosphate guanylyltransferase